VSASGDFSLDKFVTGWNKLSRGAKTAMFSSAHLQHIDDIVNMGEQFKGSLATANKSHTAQALILWELASHVGEGAIALGAGLLDPMYAGYAIGGFAATNLFTRWLASPSKSAAMRVWGNAYQGVLREASPARVASFKLATRNLATRLNIPVDRIMSTAGMTANPNGEANNAVYK